MPLPTVILHTGVSVDGRLDWGITEEGPYYMLVQQLGSEADLSGSNTVLKAVMPEDPQNAYPELYQMYAGKPGRPLMVIVDSRGQVKNWRAIKRQPFWRDFVALCSHATPQSHLDYLWEEGVHTIIAGDNKVDLRRALEELNERFNVNVVRVDSGGTLNGVLLRAGLVSEVSVVIYPALVGGMTPQTMFVAENLTGPEGVIPVELTHVEKLLDNYVWLRYKVKC